MTARPRSRGTGVKVLISAAAVGATLAGWALFGHEARQAEVAVQPAAGAGIPVAQPPAALPTRIAPSTGVTTSGPRIVTAPPRVVPRPPLIITRSSR